MMQGRHPAHRSSFSREFSVVPGRKSADFIESAEEPTSGCSETYRVLPWHRRSSYEPDAPARGVPQGPRWRVGLVCAKDAKLSCRGNSQALEVIPSRTQSLIAFPDIPLKSAIIDALNELKQGPKPGINSAVVVLSGVADEEDLLNRKLDQIRTETEPHDRVLIVRGNWNDGSL